jgi:hypothetical protein
MKLFTKDINNKLFKQYPLGSNLEKQVAVAKVFNPYGDGRWFLLNSDPEDPDYIWAIVQMNGEVEMGSISRRELETLKVGRWKLPLERDLGFQPINALKLMEGLRLGKFYKDGGWVEYAMGGAVKWQDAQIGDSARVIAENKTGLIIQAYGRKFHLKFVDGSEKTYDAKELEFFKDDDYARGGSVNDDSDWKRRQKMFGFKPFGKTLGRYKVTFIADGKDQSEIWDSLEMAVSAANRYLKIPDFSSVKVFDESGSEIKFARGGSVNYGRSWAADRAKYNKNEDYEIPLKDRSMARGGEVNIEAQNKHMLLNYAEELEHHTKEFEEAAKKADKVMPWVIAKIERASTDLSDVTHYLDSENKVREEMVTGEEIDDFDRGGEIREFNVMIFHKIKTRDGSSIDAMRERMIVTGSLEKVLSKTYSKMMPNDSYAIIIDRAKEVGVARINADGTGKVSHEGYGLNKGDIELEKEVEVEEVEPKKKKLFGLFEEGGEVWKKGSTVSFKTKAEADKRLKLMKVDGSYKNLRVEKTTSGWAVKFDFTGNKMAKGGVVVTSIKDIPNFQEMLDAGKVTYRGLGLGKLFDDFYKIAGTGGYRIKVGGKEYFITDTEFQSFSRGEDGKLRVRFDAPFRKFKEGGEVSFADKVSAVKSSLLKRKKVAPAVQKDYGKTFSPKEALDSAKRIVGAMTAKERLKAKLKRK